MRFIFLVSQAIIATYLVYSTILSERHTIRRQLWAEKLLAVFSWSAILTAALLWAKTDRQTAELVTDIS